MAFDRDGPKLSTVLLIAALSALAGYNHTRAKRALVGRAHGHVMEVDGLRLHFIEAGTGMPLILLHGNGSMAQDFKSSGIFDQAAKTYRVLAFDRPGFGRSTRSRGRRWSARDQADLIHAAAGRLGIENYIVLGHSWGAWVALELARRHSRSVAGVVLVSGYYYPPPRLDLALAALPALPFVGTAFRHTLLPVLVRLAWPWTMQKIFHPADVAADFAVLAKDIASRPSQLRAVCSESASMLAAALLTKASYTDIGVPTGILAGSGDRLFDAEGEARRLHAEVGGSLLDVVEGAGHMVHQSAPGAVIAMVDTIAGRHSSSEETGGHEPASSGGAASPDVPGGR
ncbi:alpha/beta hydrolase [Mesorhizobium sp. B2-3-14]|uniref:Putative hydrolase or acyltransferase of alpha/beta superfamily n=1 Tax=Mesorhizobium australicum (strain HAMBI 3006 / LMG 24608 / WSM2073) TaxID=754035 RepID=L0KIY5_MESAW|nr:MULTISPECIES: alpha/beta hydrolase [Mesorhizobium]AGB44971.1 putative hydrolase or acyltransferase of alpha/beta superfamily [Mesorhizobium australicum WSM2073]TPL88893.1 alpha/beta hydrolase [Mesorhizobium sp. B2-3-14]